MARTAICLVASSLMALTGLAAVSSAHAEGYIAGKAEKLPDLVIGLGDAGFGKEGGDYSIVTGKGYSLKIKSTGKHECAIVAPQFFNNIYIRKVEINKVEIKLHGLYEIEMEEEGEAELYFVAIRPGEYTWACRNLEEKGLTGKFSIK
jgi:uncharacterized cupredoxin-like copper-binding protein